MTVFSQILEMGTTLYNPVYVFIAFVDGDRILAHGELHGFGFLC